MSAELSTFARWQPEYAAHGIALYPMRDKRPAIRGYAKIGLGRSRALARQFPDADAFGFVAGKRSGVTVLDVDTSDETVLADALDRHGKTPLIVRSGGHGHWQAWYKWNGERRRIRPNRSLPIDLIGAGGVVAPPSQGGTRPYEIISGSLDDLDRIPVMQAVPLGWTNMATHAPPSNAHRVAKGARNDALWRHCMKNAWQCDDFETLLDVARTFNSFQCAPPLGDDEVARSAASAWKATERGNNWFADSHLAFARDDMMRMLAISDGDPRCGQDAWILFCHLHLNHRLHHQFTITNDRTGEALRWHRARLRGARAHLLRYGFIHQIAVASGKAPALFAWGPARKAGQAKCLLLTGVVFDHPTGAAA